MHWHVELEQNVDTQILGPVDHDRKSPRAEAGDAIAGRLCGGGRRQTAIGSHRSLNHDHATTLQHHAKPFPSLECRVITLHRALGMQRNGG